MEPTQINGSSRVRVEKMFKLFRKTRVSINGERSEWTNPDAEYVIDVPPRAVSVMHLVRSWYTVIRTGKYENHNSERQISASS